MHRRRFAVETEAGVHAR